MSYYSQLTQQQQQQQQQPKQSPISTPNYQNGGMSGALEKPADTPILVNGYSDEEEFSAAKTRELMSATQKQDACAFRVILKMIQDLIERAALRGKGAIYFEVPQTLFGISEYNVPRIGKLLVESLHSRGFSIFGLSVYFKVAWTTEEVAKSDAKKIIKEYKLLKLQYSAHLPINYLKNFPE